MNNFIMLHSLVWSKSEDLLEEQLKNVIIQVDSNETRKIILPSRSIFCIEEIIIENEDEEDEYIFTMIRYDGGKGEPLYDIVEETVEEIANMLKD